MEKVKIGRSRSDVRAIDSKRNENRPRRAVVRPCKSSVSTERGRPRTRPSRRYLRRRVNGHQRQGLQLGTGRHVDDSTALPFLHGGQHEFRHVRGGAHVHVDQVPYGGIRHFGNVHGVQVLRADVVDCRSWPVLETVGGEEKQNGKINK